MAAKNGLMKAEYGEEGRHKSTLQQQLMNRQHCCVLNVNTATLFLLPLLQLKMMMMITSPPNSNQLSPQLWLQTERLDQYQSVSPVSIRPILAPDRPIMAHLWLKMTSDLHLSLSLPFTQDASLRLLSTNKKKLYLVISCYHRCCCR